MKKTKIICSIGPASSDYEIFKKMVENGMNVARINFSHANDEEKQTVKSLVEKINENRNYHVAILYDTKGPDFRTGSFENGQIELVEGNRIKLVKEDILGNHEKFTVNYKELINDIQINDTILLEDGLMKLLVVEKDLEGITCQVINGGILGDHKGINVPGVKLNIPFISAQDEEDIRYACAQKGDYLALSFVSSKEDVESARRILEDCNDHHMQIVSKIESHTAIQNIDEIIEASDGIMVARGDLGVEVPMQMLPILQKQIIQKCRSQGKFCIVATEMLSSMQKNARPTRAEVSDIANAVLDGSDAVMLSGETTVGKYPDLAVKYMADICEQTEKYLSEEAQVVTHLDDITSVIARNVVQTSNILDIDVIVAATMSGETARKISALKPRTPILATCPTEETARSLALNWGVYPTLVDVYQSTDEIVECAKEKANEFMHLPQGSKIVITGGFPNNAKDTNFLKIETL